MMVHDRDGSRLYKVTMHDDTPVDAEFFSHPVPSAGTGVAEAIDYRSFLHETGRLSGHDGHLVDDTVLLLLLQGGGAELLDIDHDCVTLHLGSVRPGGGGQMRMYENVEGHKCYRMWYLWWWL